MRADDSHRWFRVGVAVLPLVMIASGMAAAQDLGPYEQRGLRTGTLNFFPSLSFDVGYNDNVRAVPDDSFLKEGDFVFVVSPELRAETNTQRHGLFLNAFASIGRFTDITEENFNDFGVTAGGTWDVTRTFAINANFSFAQTQDPATDPDRTLDEVVEPSTINRFAGNIVARKDWARSFAILRFGVNARRFEELEASIFPTLNDLINDTPQGTVDANQGRDVNTFRSAFRIGFSPSRNYDLFTSVGFRANRFPENDISFVRWGSFAPDLCTPILQTGETIAGVTPANCASVQSATTADSSDNFDVYTLAIGTSVDFDRLVAGEFSIGVDYRDNEDPANEDGFGLAFNGDLDWTLSPRTSLNLSLAQGFEPTRSGAAQVTDIGARLAYALTPSAQIGANAGYGRDDREDVDRTDNTFLGGVFASYAVNRYLTVGANYDYEQRDSTEAGRDFTRNVVFLNLVGRY